MTSNTVEIESQPVNFVSFCVERTGGSPILSRLTTVGTSDTLAWNTRCEFLGSQYAFTYDQRLGLRTQILYSEPQHTTGLSKEQARCVLIPLRVCLRFQFQYVSYISVAGQQTAQSFLILASPRPCKPCADADIPHRKLWSNPCFH
jgi:hypothetical protein